MVLLIAIDCHNTGKKDEADGNTKYIGRVKEAGRTSRRHSSFILAYGQTWVNFMDGCADVVAELMKLNRNKREYYQKV